MLQNTEGVPILTLWGMDFMEFIFRIQVPSSQIKFFITNTKLLILHKTSIGLYKTREEVYVWRLRITIVAVERQQCSLCVLLSYASLSTI